MATMLLYVIFAGLAISETRTATLQRQNRIVVNEDDDVLLKCNGNEGSACSWRKLTGDGSTKVVAVSGGSSTDEKFKLIDFPSSGECSLIISKAASEDSSKYTCFIAPETLPVAEWTLDVKQRNPEEGGFKHRIVEHGDLALMECKGKPGRKCFWTKVGDDNMSSVVAGSGLTPTERYVMTDAPEEADCSIAIYNTVASDSGKFSCEIRSETSSFAFWNLTVVVPGNPQDSKKKKKQ